MTTSKPGLSDSQKGELFGRISAAVLGAVVYPRVPLELVLGLEADLDSNKQTNNPLPSAELDDNTFEAVLPVLNQTLTMGEQIHQNETAHANHAELLEQMPNGIVLVTDELEVITGNEKGQQSLNDLLADAQKSGLFRERFKRIVEEQANPSVTFSSADDERLVIVAGKEAINSEDEYDYAVLHFIPNGFDFKQLHGKLRDLYQLTASEADLVVGLAQGLSLNDIAEQRGRSLNTIRTQSKTVFEKTGTKRQGELISLVLAGDIRLSSNWKNSRNVGSAPTMGVDLHPGAEFQLPDGRSLGYVEYGPADGKPLMFFNYMLGNVMLLPGRIDVLADAGVRLIAVDRSGAGKTSVQSGRQISDWPQDVARLADHLNLQQFSVFGFAAGGPYAAACAALLGDRIDRLGLASTMPPFLEIADICEVDLAYRFLIKAAHNTPAVCKRLLRLRYRGNASNPAKMFKEISAYRTDSDGDVAAQSWLQKRANIAFQTYSPRSLDEIVEEAMLFMLDYGFSFAEIETSTIVWHGGQDQLVPLSHAQAMASLMPNCEFDCDENRGHFFVFNEFHNMALRLMT